MRSLALIPSLRNLRITSRFAPDSFTGIFADDLGDSCFTLLEDLSLGSVTNIQALGRLLRLIKPSVLLSITVSYTLSADPVKDIQALSHSISLHRQLHVLSLTSNRPPSDTIKEHDMLCLGQLQCLREVYLTDVLSFASPECSVIRLLATWRGLRTIHVIHSSWLNLNIAAQGGTVLLRPNRMKSPKLIFPTNPPNRHKSRENYWRC